MKGSGTRNGMLCALLGLQLASCTPGKHAFLQVQGCLSDERGVAAFVEEMQAIALSEHMTFIDNSEKSAQQMKDVGYVAAERTHGSRVLSVSIHGPDRVGVSAGNLGMSGFEIVLGFSEGLNPELAHAFADRVVMRLGRFWPLEVVPAGSGAKSKGGCP